MTRDCNVLTTEDWNLDAAEMMGWVEEEEDEEGGWPVPRPAATPATTAERTLPDLDPLSQKIIIKNGGKGEKGQNDPWAVGQDPWKGYEKGRNSEWGRPPITTTSNMSSGATTLLTSGPAQKLQSSTGVLSGAAGPDLSLSEKFRMMNASLPDLTPTGFISVSGEVAIHPADDGRRAETRSSATAGGSAETAKQRAKRRLDEYYQAVDQAKQNYVKRIENSEGDVTPPPGLRKRQSTQSTIATRRLRQLRQQRTDQLLDPTDDQRPGEKENFESSDGRKGRKSSKRGYGNGHDESDVSEHEFDRRARYAVRRANHAKHTQSKHQASSDEAGERHEHEHMNMGMGSQGLGSIRERGMDMSSMNMSVSFGDGGTRN